MSFQLIASRTNWYLRDTLGHRGCQGTNPGPRVQQGHLLALRKIQQRCHELSHGARGKELSEGGTVLAVEGVSYIDPPIIQQVDGGAG